VGATLCKGRPKLATEDPWPRCRYKSRSGQRKPYGALPELTKLNRYESCVAAGRDRAVHELFKWRIPSAETHGRIGTVALKRAQLENRARCRARSARSQSAG
jgi:hypothetical protein